MKKQTSVEVLKMMNSDRKEPTLRGHGSSGAAVLREEGWAGGEGAIVELTRGWAVLTPLRQLA